MEIRPSDTYESFVSREYEDIRSLVAGILSRYGFHGRDVVDHCTSRVAEIIGPRRWLERYEGEGPVRAWNYLSACARLPVLQYAEAHTRMWPTVRADMIPVEPDEQDEGPVTRSPRELQHRQSQDALHVREYLAYLAAMSDGAAAQMVADRMAGYTDAEIEERLRVSHTLIARYLRDAQVAYCQCTGMHIEPGPKERVVPPAAYTSADAKLSRRRQRR